MKHRWLLSLIFALTATALWAQTDHAKDKNERRIYLSGKVMDSFTKAMVPDAFVTLLREDSTVVDTTHVYQSLFYTGRSTRAVATRYVLDLPPVSARYILRVEHPNYETAEVPYELKRVGARTINLEGPTVMLKKAARADHYEGGEIDGVVVRATKVKMVWRGDTLVYNADAFNVPEGSMLDGLIRQLPGVELHDNGEIYVNGERVENLTLNGADFFKGKNKIMLDNLPYYTVKNVEVYRKQTDENRLLGRTDEALKEYTMDVILKREYNHGATTNLEVGYGPTLPTSRGDDRYRFKGFGLYYTDNLRAILYGGTNNVNESIEFDDDGKDKSKARSAGNRRNTEVGSSLFYNGKGGSLTNTTEVRTSWLSDHTETRLLGETYLNAGSSFNQSATTATNKPFALTADNRFRLRGKLNVYADARFYYRHAQDATEALALTAADALLADTVNTSFTRQYSRRDNLSGTLFSVLSHNFSTGDDISLSLNASFYHTSRAHSFAQNRYTYYNSATSDDRNRYSETPQNNHHLSATLGYRRRLSKTLDLRTSYSLRTGYQNQSTREYRLDQLGALWATDGDHAFGSLPSTRDSLLLAADLDNTNRQTSRSTTHQGGITLSYDATDAQPYYFNVYANFNFNYRQEQLGYYSEPLTTTLHRNYFYLSPYLGLYLMSKDRSRRLNFSYRLSSQTPNISQLIDLPVTSDPLSLRLGNPDLRMQSTHNFDLSGTLRSDSTQRVFTFNMDGSLTHNAIANGYTYDPATGAYTYRPENISGGNWKVGTTLNYNCPLGHRRFFTLGHELRFSFEHSNDLAYVSGSSSSERSKVRTTYVRYKPNVRFQRDKLTMRLTCEVGWQSLHRNITTDVLPDNIYNYSCALYASYKLPLDFTIDTDLSLRARRGYADAEMNDNRVYWDASLTKSLAKGRWVMKLRGYDLLGQVSNLSYRINAQGRTETWTNALHRYVLLSASYRFTKVPKKK